jgi:hypothetical protein
MRLAHQIHKFIGQKVREAPSDIKRLVVSPGDTQSKLLVFPNVDVKP